MVLQVHACTCVYMQASAHTFKIMVEYNHTVAVACTCMYVCMYVYTHTYIHTCVFSFVHTGLCVLCIQYMHVCVYSYMHVYMYYT